MSGAPPTRAGSRVVVGVPAYGNPEGARGTVEALLAQDVAGLRVVVADDDPSGTTIAALGSLAADPRLVLTANPVRLGLARNWQRLIDIALELEPGAEYFAWASDHDEWRPGWLCPLVECLDADAGAVLACGRAVWVRPQGKGGGRAEAAIVAALEQDPVARARTVLADGDPGAMIYGLIRISALRQTGGFRAVALPDRLLLVELALLGRIHRVEDSTWGRSRHTGGRERQRAALFPEGAPFRAFLPPRAVHGLLLAWKHMLPRRGSSAVSLRTATALALVAATTTPGGFRHRATKRFRRLRRRIASARGLTRGVRPRIPSRPSTGQALRDVRRTRVLLALNDSFVRNVENVVAALRRAGCEVILCVPKRGDGAVMDAFCARYPDIVWGRTPKPRSAEARLRKRLLDLADSYWYQGWLGDPTVGHQRRKLERAGVSLESDAQPRPAMAMRQARLLRALAARVRADTALKGWLRALAPDIVVVVPGVSPKQPEAEVIAAAGALRIPLVSAIASWDNLTTKGMVRIGPQRFVVWGAAQCDEAVRLHHVDGRAVAVVGAHTYDHWFDRGASVHNRRETLAVLNVAPASRYVLWVGSASLVENEEEIVAEWLRALATRAAFCDGEVAVVIRSHPQKCLDPARIVVPPGLVCAIRDDPLPVAAAEKDWYRALVSHAALVVGINTSAMWEAAVFGVSVLSFSSGCAAQCITHARYLHGSPESLLGDRLPTLVEHVSEIEACLAGAPRLGEVQERCAAFVRTQVASPHAGVASADVFARAVGSCAEAGRPKYRIVLPARHPFVRLASAAAIARSARQRLRPSSWYRHHVRTS